MTLEAASRMTGPGDLRDLRWLDGRIEAINDGVEAVIDIARNWTDGRGLARLFPGTSAAEYITARVGALGKTVVPVLLSESNWSNRQIATVAGVSHDTVNRAARQLDEIVQLPDRPAETLGADGKYRPAHVVREVRAEVIEPLPQEPQRTPFRVIAQTFERDARRLLEGYRPHLDDERFAARYGDAMASLSAALEGDTR